VADVIKTDDPIHAAATLVQLALRPALGRGATLAIAGGSAASAVGDVRKQLGEHWAQITLTWVDERCVPFAHADSNRGTAYRKGWLSESDRPLLEVALFQDGETPEQAVQRLATPLAYAMKLTVTLLGMGEDGHVASLFPGRDWEGGGAPAMHVSGSPKPPPDRITLTKSLLATVPTHVLLATGEGKRDALVKLLAGDPSLPASGLAGLTIVTDLDLGERA
jgi:6-phosphogluconolactonase